jgi:hypothetical protein
MHSAAPALALRKPVDTSIAREIEATFGCEPMPAEVGTVLVHNVVMQSRRLGEVRLYDCLFSDTHPWVLRRPHEERAPALEVDASRLTDKGLAVVTVLAALIRLVWTALQRKKWRGAVSLEVETDEGLGKDKLLAALAWIQKLDEPPETSRDLAAKSGVEAAMREIEALTAAWEGDDAPSDAMVAWASGFLAGGDVGIDGSVARGLGPSALSRTYSPSASSLDANPSPRSWPIPWPGGMRAGCSPNASSRAST